NLFLIFYLHSFSKKFNKRLFDVGIAEQHGVTFAAGLAVNGLIPVVAIYSSFLQRAYDQVIHDVAMQNLHIVFAIDRAGIVGADGETHQGIYDIAFLKHIPNLEIIQPSNKKEAWQLLDYAFKYTKNSVAIRYSKNYTKNEELTEYQAIKKPTWNEFNKDAQANLISYGDNFTRMHKYIKTNNININLYNAMFIKPLDKLMLEKIISSNKKTYVLEDVTKISGLGSSILEYLAEEEKQLDIKILGLPDEFIEQGSQAKIYKKYNLDEKSIINTILK
ncbi:MAG: transketolase C-terminal domain-containing protein, partial [Bacillota bacterium]